MYREGQLGCVPLRRQASAIARPPPSCSRGQAQGPARAHGMMQTAPVAMAQVGPTCSYVHCCPADSRQIDRHIGGQTMLPARRPPPAAVSLAAQCHRPPDHAMHICRCWHCCTQRCSLPKRWVLRTLPNKVLVVTSRNTAPAPQDSGAVKGERRACPHNRGRLSWRCTAVMEGAWCCLTAQRCGATRHMRARGKQQLLLPAPPMHSSHSVPVGASLAEGMHESAGPERAREGQGNWGVAAHAYATPAASSTRCTPARAGTAPAALVRSRCCRRHTAE
jgi:hypothetical protein